MLFLSTQPSALEDPSDIMTWMKFRVTDGRARLAALRDLVRGDTPLVVGAPGMPVFGATLWSLDEANERMHLSVDPKNSGNVRDTLNQPSVWAAAYVDAVKLQFPMVNTQLNARMDSLAVSASLPRDLYRMPRRRNVRLRRDIKSAPRLVLHPECGYPSDRTLVVLDISECGCALFLPSDMHPPAPGMLLRKLELRLDEDTFVFTDLVVHNLQRAARGSHRMGCSWKGMPEAAQERLREWMQRGQVGLNRLSLQFD
jgi:flagellar brake protein